MWLGTNLAILSGFLALAHGTAGTAGTAISWLPSMIGICVVVTACYPRRLHSWSVVDLLAPCHKHSGIETIFIFDQKFWQ